MLTFHNFTIEQLLLLCLETAQKNKATDDAESYFGI